MYVDKIILFIQQEFLFDPYPVFYMFSLQKLSVSFFIF